MLSTTPIVNETRTFTTKHISLSTDEAVDLGLRVKWASKNLGATNIRGNNSSYSQWLATDVVESQLGGEWRMPTAKEAEELIDLPAEMGDLQRTQGSVAGSRQWQCHLLAGHRWS